MEVSKDFAHDSVQWCFAEQTIENLAIVLAVKIIEAPVNRTHEKTQQLVNTHVQHVVNTVEVEQDTQENEMEISFENCDITE